MVCHNLPDSGQMKALNFMVVLKSISSLNMFGVANSLFDPFISVTLKLVKHELLPFSITSAGHLIQHHQAQNDYWNSGRPLFMHISSNYLFCLDVKREEQEVQ